MSKVISIVMTLIQVHVLQQSYCCFCLEDGILISAAYTCEESYSGAVAIWTALCVLFCNVSKKLTMCFEG